MTLYTMIMLAFNLLATVISIVLSSGKGFYEVRYSKLFSQAVRRVVTAWLLVFTTSQNLLRK